MSADGDGAGRRLPPGEQAAGARPSHAGAPTQATRRVLLIEDDPDIAEIMRELLTEWGLQVSVARSGEEGLAKARALVPDLVLCDLGLPGMDGCAVARAIRAEEALRGIRLVALTGQSRADDLQRTVAAGFDDHVAKPPRLQRLREVVERALRR